MTASIEEVARGLTEAQRRTFLQHTSDEWHRISHIREKRGGRWANFNRRRKFIKMGLLEHRINAGAQYRLTPTGIAVRAFLEKQP